MLFIVSMNAILSLAFVYDWIFLSRIMWDDDDDNDDEDNDDDFWGGGGTLFAFLFVCLAEYPMGHFNLQTHVLQS